MKPTPGPVLKNRKTELKMLTNCLTQGHIEQRIPELDVRYRGNNTENNLAYFSGWVAALERKNTMTEWEHILVCLQCSTPWNEWFLWGKHNIIQIRLDEVCDSCTVLITFPIT